jgi:hypothetical protein
VTERSHRDDEGRRKAPLVSSGRRPWRAASTNRLRVIDEIRARLAPKQTKE